MPTLGRRTLAGCIPLEESPGARVEELLRDLPHGEPLEVDLESPEGCWRCNRRTIGRLLGRRFFDVELRERGGRLVGRASGRRTRPGPPFIAGVMRVRNEARYIGMALRSLEPVADVVAVLDNESEDATAEICRGFDHVAGVARGWKSVDSTRDFNRILELGLRWSPDWILKLDGDEQVEDGAGTVLRDLCRRPGLAIINLLYYHYWDDERTIRVDGPYSPHINWNPRLFNISRQEASRLRYPTTRHGGNEFVPQYPNGLVGREILADAVVWHYGHLDPEERREKFEFYTRLDPTHAPLGLFDHIVSPARRLRVRPDRSALLPRLMHRIHVQVQSALTRQRPWSSWTRSARMHLLEILGVRTPGKR